MAIPTGSGTPCAQAGGTLRPAHEAAPRAVRRVLVVNAKGGCGKTTIATNLAACFASGNLSTALIDHDPQGSSMQWLALRGSERRPIHGVAAFRTASNVTRSFQMRLPQGTERVVLDAPAGVQGQALIEMVRDVHAIIIPVLPSPIDIHAASHFIRELLLVAKVRARSIQVGVVANRVRPQTRVYRSLKRFLDSLNIPLVAHLRDAQHYVHAAEAGIGLGELHAARIGSELAQWGRLLDWIEGRGEFAGVLTPGPERTPAKADGPL